MKIKSREELGKKKNDIDNLLEDLLPKYSAVYPNMVYDVGDRLEEKNIFIGTISSIFGSIIRTYELDEVEELGSFLKALYEVGLDYEVNGVTIPELHRLDPELYYDDNELSAIDLYERDIPKNNDIIRLYVRKNSDCHYACSHIGIKEYIENYFNNGLLMYNINTQRQTTKKVKKDEIYQSITIYKKNVRKMINKMKEDRFNPNTLTLNIRDNGHQIYDDGGMKVGEFGWLTIQVKGRSYCDILDGMHRSLAYQEYVKIRPDTDKYTMLSIFVFDEKEALAHISQENEGEKINVQSLERRDPENTGVAIAKDLRNKSSKLRGKIADDMLDLIQYKKYTDILTLGNGLNLNFPEVDKRPSQKFKLTKYLSEFFDLAIDFYDDYFEKENIEPKQIYHRNNLFIAFSCIAKCFEGRKEWQDELLELLSELDINKLLSITPDKKVLKPQDVKKINVKMKHLLPITEGEVATTNE